MVTTISAGSAGPRSWLALPDRESLLQNPMHPDRIAPVGSAAVGEPVHGLTQAVVRRD
jgi:hypothetical protein